MVNPAEMGGRRPGEKPSSFSVTCSLLRQYLKEKGSFGDLSLGMTAAAAGSPPVDGRGKPEIPRTMNLLPGVDAVGGDEESAANKDAVSDLKKGPIPSIELFPQSVDLGNKSDLNREPQAETAQMTIFYGGKVVIFDNFPADKAKELMMMAGRGTSPAVPPQRPTWPQSPPLNSAAARLTSISDSNKPVAGTAVVPSVAAAQEAQQKPSQTATSDLPIARRVSLHRFLEKRKDRISAKAPYQLNGAPGAPASFSASAAKPEESSQWLGLAPQVSIPEDLRR